MPRHPVQLCDLSDYPEYSCRVGSMMAVWAIIEMHMSNIFGALLRAPPWTAWQAFFAIANAKARTDMVHALGAALDHRIPEKDELIALVERMRKAATVRNNYAHRPWLLSNGKLFQLDGPTVPAENSKKHRVTIKQLDKDQAILVALCNGVSGFSTRFGNKYRLPLEPFVSREPHVAWPGKWPEHIPRRK